MIRKRFSAKITTLQTFWLLISFSTVVSFLGLGGGYAFGGSQSVYSLEPFKYIDLIPGGIHMHGVVMCLLALSLLWGIAGIVQSRGQAAVSWLSAKISLIAITFYSAWCTYAFAAAWISNHHYVGITWLFVGTMISTGALLASTSLVRHASMKSAMQELEAAVTARVKGDQHASANRSL